MPIVANAYRHVVGVDTHAATHTFALVECPTGALLDTATFPTTPAGRARAVGWVQRRCLAAHGGDLDWDRGSVLVSLEGAGSYGALIAEDLAAAGVRVVEAPTPTRSRARGKSDDLDALAAARSSMAMDLTTLRNRRGTPDQAGQVRAALAVLSTAREQLNAERLRALNALTALLRRHDLGIDARRALTEAQIAQVARWRTRTEPLGVATARHQSIRLATRIQALGADLKENRTAITALIDQHAPHLTAALGIGPVVAATVLAAWSHPGRVRSEAAFAMIAGTAPIPASSGNTTRHRLNRGGDRRLNNAINTIVLTRMRLDPATRTYIERRRSQGKTDREIRRCLKRYITRQLYRNLNNPTPTPLDAT